ncbi:rhomboid family intramembrane serine protease [Sinomonas notoginsengisoli]|uniref:rhomboid family intramembrane serine protease n=1 Tax=Sinomonas notoginsengisoli TaxID=1457311 RepID=UPI001F24E1CA|nr:rhomboid family intramembrane serine protease [Sinomonas notoginsengisoli]
MAFGSPAAGPESIPVCPRHPDRVSYVTCQRCGRPACPECQRPAAVGFHCVDCVRELSAERKGSQARTAYGGTVSQGGRPAVTLTLIGVCALAYLLQWVIPGFSEDFAYANSAALTAAQPWRMLTSAFLHSQGFLLHIVLNMYTLWLFGQALEPYLGRTRFLAVYLLSALGGSVGFLLLTPHQEAVVGASGAIFGLFGGLFVVMRQRGGDVRQLVILIAINAVLGFMIQGIAWQAHLGGLLTGAVSTAVIAYAPRGRARTGVQIGGLVAVAVVLVAATLVKVSSVPVHGGAVL